ncbi:MAG: hypothetical protein ACI9F9_001277 [Candidatus Paceibacteria bacterium]|jgi:hypothetical protein
MDHNVSRIIAGTIYAARSAPKKKQNSEEQQPFSLATGETAPAVPPDASATHHEPLPVSRPEADEAGGQLNLTA